MAYGLRVTVQYGWIPDGAGGAALGQRQADWPGVGAAGASPGPIFTAQTAQDYVFEMVPGGDSPSSSNFNTALSQAATDLQTQLTTVNDVPGFTSGTLLAQIQAWSSGGA